MLFNLGNPNEVELFKKRIDFLIDRKKKVELTEKKRVRTNSQNRYLHLILSFFGLQTGNTLDFVKQEYFKKLCNSEVFILEKNDEFLGLVRILKSTSDIDTKTMSIAIDRFRNWSASEAGIYLPSANEEGLLEYIQEEIDRNKKWL